ncbi:uncharacterized protein LOC131811671 isoform X2 [Mustela lutreola]|uniref:uncharacterized protein LOC131811671 isoform X2 n=1 Tax=Mustela lutreola TaxID=9666 RepID=UPI002796EF28|nr:uncharacterized protein LOC131811671 isoform X2 [Mustela lutreola]
MGSQLHLPLPPPYFAPPPPARQGAEKKALPPGSPALECRLVAKLRISPKYPETRGSARDPWGRRSCLSMRDSSYLFSGVIPCSLQPETPPADSPAGGYNKLFREKHGSWSSFCKAWRCLDRERVQAKAGSRLPAEQGAQLPKTQSQDPEIMT